MLDIPCPFVIDISVLKFVQSATSEPTLSLNVVLFSNDGQTAHLFVYEMPPNLLVSYVMSLFLSACYI